MSAVRNLALQTFGVLYQDAERVAEYEDRHLAVQAAATLGTRIDMAFMVMTYLRDRQPLRESLSGELREDALEVAAHLLEGCVEKLNIATERHRGDQLLMRVLASSRRLLSSARAGQISYAPANGKGVAHP